MVGVEDEEGRRKIKKTWSEDKPRKWKRRPWVRTKQKEEEKKYLKWKFRQSRKKKIKSNQIETVELMVNPKTLVT